MAGVFGPPSLRSAVPLFMIYFNSFEVFGELC